MLVLLIVFMWDESKYLLLCVNFSGLRLMSGTIFESITAMYGNITIALFMLLNNGIFKTLHEPTNQYIHGL